MTENYDHDGNTNEPDREAENGTDDENAYERDDDSTYVNNSFFPISWRINLLSIVGVWKGMAAPQMV